jgi:hypothetical protein
MPRCGGSLRAGVRETAKVLRPTFALLTLMAVHGFFAIGPAEADCVALPAGAVAWWPMEEAAAVDVVGGMDASTVGEPAVVAGKVGSAVMLDGVDDCLFAADSAAWAFGAGEFTIELWVRIDVGTGGHAGQPGDVLLDHSTGPGLQDK